MLSHRMFTLHFQERATFILSFYVHLCCYILFAVLSLLLLVPVLVSTLTAYFHQRSRIRTRIPNPIITSYYAEVFPLHGLRLRFGFGSLSRMVTVTILGTDVYPKDRSLSELHTFQSGYPSLNPNRWKNPT